MHVYRQGTRHTRPSVLGKWLRYMEQHVHSSVARDNTGKTEALGAQACTHRATRVHYRRPGMG
ncbi:hypothetical protein TorRG33x02_000230 [Trema orientale]|uniref:Uncharacterized protein n=1 Tax=Trema orientale TaxID=63057 RepID=A0A2P5G127_TREOI|nr:hypothetical protein TorRG33x02_000230 [Trema orientale]